MSIQRIETSPLPFPRKNHLWSPLTMFLWNIHIWVSDGGERCHWKNEAIQSCRPRFPRNHQLEHLWRLLWSLCSALRTSLNASWLSLLAPRRTFDICGTLPKIWPPMMPTSICWHHLSILTLLYYIHYVQFTLRNGMKFSFLFDRATHTASNVISWL